MREGKFIEELHKQICAIPDEKGATPDDLVHLANVVATVHPIWYERFRIRTLFVRGWKWVTSGTWFARSKKRGDSSVSDKATGSSTSRSQSVD